RRRARRAGRTSPKDCDSYLDRFQLTPPLLSSNQSSLRLFDEEAVMQQTDRLTLEMALIGYEAERQKIEAAIAAIRKQVDGRAAASAVDGAHRPKRVMSAAAKRRIAAAQRKRWAAFHADQKGGTKKTGPR